MVKTTMNVQLLQVVHTTDEWSSILTNIPKGMICVETTTGGDTLTKIGDGNHPFSELAYTTVPVMTGATASGTGEHAGTKGLVPAPAIGDNLKYLAGDGTWKSLPTAPSYDLTTIASSESSASSGSYDGIQITADGTAIGNGIDLGLFDGSGLIKSALLPSYVDDVVEGYYYNGAFYSDSKHTQVIAGETGKIYIDLSENGTYRWSGSAYVNISNPIDADAIYTLLDTDTDGAYSATKHGLVPAYEFDTDGVKFLRANGNGWATLAVATGLTIDGTATPGTTEIGLSAAEASTLGGVKVAIDSAISNTSGAIDVKLGTGLAKDNSNNIALSKATSSTLGGVIVDTTDGLSVDSDGKVGVNTGAGLGINSSSGAVESVAFTGANGTAAGSIGAVPAPAATDNVKFLKGDGTWSTVESAITFDSHSDPYDASTNPAATVDTVNDAIATLDVPSTGDDAITGMGADKTILTLTETDGKIGATFQSISITKSNISDYNTSFVSDVAYDTTTTPTTPVLKYKKGDGSYSNLVSVDTAVTTDSNNLVTSGAVDTAITDVIDALDGTITGPGTGKTLSAFSQTDGVVSATFADIAIPVSQIKDNQTTVVQKITLNNGFATAPTSGNVTIKNAGTAIKYNNGTQDGGTIDVANDGTFDLSNLILQCTL